MELLPAPPRVQRHSGTFDAVKKAAYVRMIRMGARRNKAAELVGVSMRTAYAHIHSDAEFRAEVEDAESARIDEVEEALYAAAIAGNVVAQQVILYNRRSDEWADQRQLKAKLEAAAVEDAEQRRRAGASALDQLGVKLNELAERLAAERVEEAEAAAEPLAADTDGG